MFNRNTENAVFIVGVSSSGDAQNSSDFLLRKMTHFADALDSAVIFDRHDG